MKPPQELPTRYAGAASSARRKPARSPPFVEAARAGLPGVEVRTAPAEQLPFDAHAFDVVLSQLVVNFMDDAELGVAEMRRVARRTVSSCVWDYADEMTMARAFWDAALAL